MLFLKVYEFLQQDFQVFLVVSPQACVGALEDLQFLPCILLQKYLVLGTLEHLTHV